MAFSRPFPQLTRIYHNIRSPNRLSGPQRVFPAYAAKLPFFLPETRQNRADALWRLCMIMHADERRAVSPILAGERPGTGSFACRPARPGEAVFMTDEVRPKTARTAGTSDRQRSGSAYLICHKDVLILHGRCL